MFQVDVVGDCLVQWFGILWVVMGQGVCVVFFEDLVLQVFLGCQGKGVGFWYVGSEGVWDELFVNFVVSLYCFVMLVQLWCVVDLLWSVCVVLVGGQLGSCGYYVVVVDLMFDEVFGMQV